MARVIVGPMTAVFTPTAGAVNTVASWVNPAGAAANVAVTLVHNLNAWVPEHASFDVHHALDVCLAAAAEYAAGAAGATGGGPVVVSTDANTIQVTWRNVPAATQIDAIVWCKRQSSINR